MDSLSTSEHSHVFLGRSLVTFFFSHSARSQSIDSSSAFTMSGISTCAWGQMGDSAENFEGVSLKSCILSLMKCGACFIYGQGDALKVTECDPLHFQPNPEKWKEMFCRPRFRKGQPLVIEGMAFVRLLCVRGGSPGSTCPVVDIFCGW